jgi:hypothetical protein
VMLSRSIPSAGSSTVNGSLCHGGAPLKMPTTGFTGTPSFITNHRHHSKQINIGCARKGRHETMVGQESPRRVTQQGVWCQPAAANEVVTACSGPLWIRRRFVYTPVLRAPTSTAEPCCSAPLALVESNVSCTPTAQYADRTTQNKVKISGIGLKVGCTKADVKSRGITADGSISDWLPAVDIAESTAFFCSAIVSHQRTGYEHVEIQISCADGSFCLPVTVAKA